MKSKRHFFSALFFVSLLCLGSKVVLGESVVIGGTNPLDARRSLPIPWLLGKSYTDGLFLDHTEIPGWGVNIQMGGLYQYKPFGDETGRQFIMHRFVVPVSAHLFISKWVDASLSIPFSLYQLGASTDSNYYPNVTKVSLGDLYLGAKARIPLPTPWIQLATQIRLGFETATQHSYLGAGQTSGGMNIILQSASFLDERLFFVANLGFFIGGNRTPCLTVAPILGTTTSTSSSSADCDDRGLGLGNHFTYGLGVSGLVWKNLALTQAGSPRGLFIETELVGSAARVGSDSVGPLFWNAGLRANIGKSWYGSLHYGLGIGSSSPSHSVMAQFGFVWQSNSSLSKPAAEEKPAGSQAE